MRRLWLGDALDFWKGSFLDVLRASSTPQRTVRILPMFTDAGWSTADVDTYGAILGVHTTQLLSTSQITNRARQTYFAVCTGMGDDIFVDPDTGVAIRNPDPSHVAAQEVFAMLSDDNVVAVYQHRPQRVPAG